MKSSSLSSSSSSAGRRRPTRFSPLEIAPPPPSSFPSCLSSPIDEAYSSLFTAEADFIARRNLRDALEMSAGTGLKRIWNGKKVVWVKDVDSPPSCSFENNTPPPTPLFRQPLADITSLNGRIPPPSSLCSPTPNNPRGLSIATSFGESDAVGGGAPSPAWSVSSGGGASLMEREEEEEEVRRRERRRERREMQEVEEKEREAKVDVWKGWWEMEGMRI